MGDWNESDHPRGEDGKFGGGSGSSSKSKTPKRAKDAAIEIVRGSNSLSQALGDLDKYTFETVHTESGEQVPVSEVRQALESLRPPPLPENVEMVTVHHSTDRESAERLMRDGVIPELKPTNLARERYERGESSEFAPGRGLSSGLYVTNPGESDSYGRVTLELTVPKSYLESPPESQALGLKDAEKALSQHDGAVVVKPIPPSAIKIRDGSSKKTTSNSDRKYPPTHSKAGMNDEEIINSITIDPDAKGSKKAWDRLYNGKPEYGQDTYDFGKKIGADRMARTFGRTDSEYGNVTEWTVATTGEKVYTVFGQDLGDGPDGTGTWILPGKPRGAKKVKKSEDFEVDMPPFKVVGSGKILIVKSAPTLTELLRQQPFVNDDGHWLQKEILGPLGLTRDQVLLAWCDPMHGGEPLLKMFIESSNPDIVISMSDTTGFVKDKRSWNLPTVEEIRKEHDRVKPELSRKIVAIKKRIDATAHRMVNSIYLVEKGDTPSDDRAKTVPIHKAFAPEKIVYGVVLDPYQVDTQDDWCPPKEIRETAYGFMKSSRVIGLQHKEVAPDAYLVESFTEPYPSESDHVKAMNNEPHRVYKRHYGKDIIHSGAWLIGVQLSDRLWKQYEKGEIGAFSIEGFGKRVTTTTEEMPKVEFVEIGEINGPK